MTHESHDELEVRIAYQDHTIEQLSQQLYEQARQIERLAERCHQLEQRVQRLAEGESESADQAPPHY
ncbi:SlyX family protein [Salinisphaera sp. SPP-AMP-43]|uniref:SlyX family protein n=1 Tax=Salinisphaera sp. SPP-AMP-43 TaxID=3121288 RepID=UPI003C6E6062